MKDRYGIEQLSEKQLVKLKTQCTSELFNNTTALVYAGQIPSNIVILESGTIEILNSRGKPLKSYGPGHMISAELLYNNSPSKYTISIKGPSRAYIVGRSFLEEFMKIVSLKMLVS